MFNHLLTVFVCAADCGSFNKAAEKLYLSAPSVMKQVNALEKQLDMKLFHRTNQGLHLTPAGQVIYRHAVAQGLSVYAVFAFICILWAYYQRSPFRFYTILHRFRLSVNMQMNRIRFCLHIPHNTNVFRCRLCSNHNTVPMIRLALK